MKYKDGDLVIVQCSNDCGYSHCWAHKKVLCEIKNMGVIMKFYGINIKPSGRECSDGKEGYFYTNRENIVAKA